MRIFVLEDESTRINFFEDKFLGHEIKIFDNSVNAINCLTENVFDYIFLDNDLGIGKGEGIDVAEFLYRNPENLNNNAVIIIHSWNVVASTRIRTYLPKSIMASFNTVNFLNLRLDI